MNVRKNLHCVLLGIAIGFMFCIFAPLDIFFTNRNEFWFSLSQLLPVLLPAFISVALIISFFLIAIQKSGAASSIYGFLLYTYLFFYIQGNYIPRDYGVLDGVEIDWAGHSAYGVMSIILAIVCILLWVVSLLKLKKKIYKLGTYLCAFVISIQLVTVGVLFLQDKIAGDVYTREEPVVTSRDLLDLSRDNNILIFMLDTFDSQDMLNLLQGDDAEEYKELFGGGFTFYPDTLGAYPTTKAAVPHILTGIWYENEKAYEEYLRDAYEASPLLNALRENDFSIGIYTEGRLLNEDFTVCTNIETGTYQVSDYRRFAARIYKLAAFNYMPHQWKRYFYLDTGEFEELKSTVLEGGAYSYDVQTNYAYLLDNGVSVTKDGNCFRLYHTAGVHPPYTFGKDVLTETETAYDVYDEAEGNCTYLRAFFDELKERGLYDDTTIIIMADHGHYDHSQNPLFMIKNAGESEGLIISEEKMSYAYLSDMLVSLVNGERVTEEYVRKYGKQARRFLYYTWDDSWGRDYLPRMQEFYNDGYAGDPESLRETGQEYKGQDDYRYNGEVVCKYRAGEIIDTIYFSTEQYNADRYVVKGLSGREEEWSWTDGDELVLTVPLNATDASYIGIHMDVRTVFYHPQTVQILIDGEKVYDNKVKDGEDIEFVFENPGTDTVELSLLLPDSAVPARLGISEDDRRLALALVRMEVAEAEYELSAVPADGIIRFTTDGYNANAYVISGIASPEKAGAWTVGRKVALRFAPDSSFSDTVHVVLDLADVPDRRQEMSILVNGNMVFDGAVSAGEKAVSFEIPCPAEETVTLELYIQGTGEDNRVMIKNIRFVEG